jgi:quercetin dioxygenase-like cupin family protein
MTMKLNPSPVIVSATVLAAFAASGVAFATPGSGFTNTPYPVGHFSPLDVKADKTDKWDLFLKTKDRTDIGVDRLSIAPGGQSGWHSHTGPVFVTVTKGSIIRYDGSDSRCPVTTYRVGHTFVEDPNVVHLVANASDTEPAEFVAVQMRPEGAAGRVDQPQPANCS